MRAGIFVLLLTNIVQQCHTLAYTIDLYGPVLGEFKDVIT